MNEALITLNNLSIGYNGQPVLSGISLSIARESFTVILGSNGSGKTTLLKTLLGLLPPIAGRIETAGNTGRSLIFGYVPQSTLFDPVYLLTGFDVALMGTYGRVRPGRLVPPAERAFAHECLRAADAEEFAYKRFAELSSGQKQRVLIARALSARPDILMLDEPTAGVDHAATHAVMEFISKIRMERRITVLLVTHDFSVVHRHAEQIIWLCQGSVLKGTADELLSKKRMAAILEMETD
ncbi:MAG TPA: ATP-binding cassette domain-containing protein [Syntrophales bacterium]|nr:ATP-binding cassette domain-containing protein [Syntrophales bacterium]